MDNYNNNYNNGDNNNYGSQYYEVESQSMQGSSSQYYENGNSNTFNDPWQSRNNQQFNNLGVNVPPQKPVNKQTDNNKVVLYVAIALGAVAVLMSIVLLIVSLVSGKKEGPDKEGFTVESTQESSPNGNGFPKRSATDYVKNGTAFVSSSGVTYYEPEFLITGSYVQSVVNEINGDLSRLRSGYSTYSENAVFQYKAYLNGDILSVKFESGYPGDMKSRYYNINVNSGERASLRQMQIQAGLSEDEFGQRLLASQRKELSKIYSANGWGDINSKTLYCTDCWNPFTSEAHMKEARFYLDDNCKIHIVNYFPGSTEDVHVLKDIVCEY